jgi:hypothetical protein
MQKVKGLAILLILGLIALGCGGSSGSANINGEWVANLTRSDGSANYNFVVTFSQGTTDALTIYQFVFTSSPSPCLVSAEPAQASFTPANGALKLKMASPAVGGPSLILQGTLVDGKISGMWNATETLQPCDESGPFTMQKVMILGM